MFCRFQQDVLFESIFNFPSGEFKFCDVFTDVILLQKGFSYELQTSKSCRTHVNKIEKN